MILEYRYRWLDSLNDSNFDDTEKAWELVQATATGIQNLYEQKMQTAFRFPMLSTTGVLAAPFYFKLRCYLLGYIVFYQDDDFPELYHIHVGIPKLTCTHHMMPDYFVVKYVETLTIEQRRNPEDHLLYKMENLASKAFENASQQHLSTAKSFKFYSSLL